MFLRFNYIRIIRGVDDMAQVEIWWIDKFAHEAWPKNPNRATPPPGAIEFVPKSEYDRLIDLLRKQGIEYSEGGVHGSGTSDSEFGCGGGSALNGSADLFGKVRC